MKALRVWLISGLAMFHPCTGLRAGETDFSAPLEEMRKLLKPLESDPADVKETKSQLRGYPDQLQRMIEQDQLSRFSSDSGLFQYQGMAARVPGLAEQLNALAALVKKEQTAREQAKIEEAEALLARVAEQLKTAKKAEELDALLSDLSGYRNDEYSGPGRLSALHRNLQSALQIVGNWQEYLIAEESGNFQESRNNLQQISSQLSSNPIIPRSMVLRLLNPAPPKRAASGDGQPEEPPRRIDGIIARLSETGDSAAAMAEIKAIPKAAMVDSSSADFLRNLEAIEVLRRLEPKMSEGEVFANLRNMGSNSQHNGRFVFNLAIDQIALNAIARHYGIETQSAKSSSARKVLESIAVEARDKRNWPVLRQAIQSLDNLGSASYSTDSAKRSYDLKIIALLELGEAAAARQDLEAAASAFFEATGIDGYYLQRGIAYERLAELKQKDPEKVRAILAKAEESRQRADAARYGAEIEARSRSSMYQRGMPGERMSEQEMIILRSVVQQVVAEFLKEKRLEAAPAAGDGKATGPGEGSGKPAGGSR